MVHISPGLMHDRLSLFSIYSKSHTMRSLISSIPNKVRACDEMVELWISAILDSGTGLSGAISLDSQTFPEDKNIEDRRNRDLQNSKNTVYQLVSGIF